MFNQPIPSFNEDMATKTVREPYSSPSRSRASTEKRSVRNRKGVISQGKSFKTTLSPNKDLEVAIGPVICSLATDSEHVKNPHRSTSM